MLSPLQVATLTGERFPVPAAFRHRAGFATLVMDWLALAVHCCDVAPVQSVITTGSPAAPPEPPTVMHLVP